MAIYRQEDQSVDDKVVEPMLPELVAVHFIPTRL